MVILLFCILKFLVLMHGSHRSGKGQRKVRNFSFSKVMKSRGILICCQICIQRMVTAIFCKHFIEYPILYSEVFLYNHITAYYIHIYLYFIKYKLYEASQKTERSLNSLAPELHSGLRSPRVFV